jgi:hypothetical protein
LINLLFSVLFRASPSLDHRPTLRAPPLMAGSESVAPERGVASSLTPAKKRAFEGSALEEDEVDEFDVFASEEIQPQPARHAAESAAASAAAPPRKGKSGGSRGGGTGRSRGSSAGRGGKAHSQDASEAADGSVLVGTEVLKNFPGHGEFEGKVLEFVAASGSSGVDVWSVLYADGDKEDMELEELSYWVAYKVQKRVEAAAAAAAARPRKKLKPAKNLRKKPLSDDMV